MSKQLQQILQDKIPDELKSLFSFTVRNTNEEILLKYNLWSRFFFIQYFKSKDAEFHKKIDLYNLQVYRGTITSFVDIAFRGAGKTSRTKLFLAFCIANDLDNYRRYIKVLSEDTINSTQVVTDIYNMLVQPRVKSLYPYIFRKTNSKREETMSSFTTSTGVKLRADTVGTTQRGAIQDDARPDLILFEDFENRKTLRSARLTKSISENMEEARTGLSKDGGAIYSCNYISEQGNVHQLVTKQSTKKVVLIVPIIENNIPTWDRYSIGDIEQMKLDDDDFEGEKMCFKPNTLISTELGLREIKDIKLGDKVWTHKGRLQKVLTIFESEDNNLIDITINAKITTVTKNHPILIMKNESTEWLPAGLLSTDDLIVEVRRDNLNA